MTADARTETTSPENGNAGNASNASNASNAGTTCPTSNIAAIRAVFSGDMAALRDCTRAQLRETDDQQRNALHATCYAGHPDMTRFILTECRELKDAGDAHGRTAALFACGAPWDYSDE